MHAFRNQKFYGFAFNYSSTEVSDLLAKAKAIPFAAIKQEYNIG